MPHTFTCSRTQRAHQIVLQLVAGNLALVDKQYLATDDELTCYVELICQPVLEHLKVNARTFTEEDRSCLNGTDCSHIGNSTANPKSGMVDQSTVAQLKKF